MSLTKITDIDWETILEPISIDEPCGSSLRYTGEYDAINDARKEDDLGLNQGVWASDRKRADWKKAEAICLNSLTQKSKDLQIAAWLMEAWMKRYSYPGLARGLELINKLAQKFWENIHPQKDQTDWEPRMGPFHWINEKLSIQIKLIPITLPQHGDIPTYRFADWETATKNENLIRKGKLDPEEGVAITQSKFLMSCNDSPRSYYYDIAKGLEDSLSHLSELEQFLDRVCEKKSPSLLELRSELNKIFRLATTTICPELNSKPPPLEDKVETTVYGHLNQSETMMQPNDSQAEAPIQSRAQAYRMLTEVANYLMETEPHSPTPYLVRRAISWGNMSLSELLREIVYDENDIRLIYQLLGMSSEQQSTNEGQEY